LLKGIKILVAEDNVINQKIVNYILEKQNAIVLNALNGKEAIDYLKETSVDIILMDLQMPGMDGLEAARYIRDVMKSNIPIIALTADTYAMESGDYLKAGFNACISKPFDPPKLWDLIVNLTEQKGHE
jgi:CheY-like chemotaxis protein